MSDFRSLETKIKEVMLAEAIARNTKLRQQVTNVGRPTAPALTKQGEIKNKILEDSDKEPDADDKKVKKNPKGVDTDDENDPKELKGGKTEVIINPNTNDNSEDQDDENKASKKITNKVNKDIGAKGVKEETMTNKNFGLPDALINAVREIVSEKKDIYAAMKARQFAKSAVKEKDPIKKAEHEKKSDEYKAKINKEEVEVLDKNIKTFIGKKIKIHQPGTSMHNMTGKVIWSNKEGSHHEVKLDQGKNAVHGFPTSAIKEEVELAEVAIEKNLEDHHPRIVSGVKGVKSTSFTKKFANHKAMEKWMDSDDGTHEIHRIEKDHNRIKEEVELSVEELARLDEISKTLAGNYVKKSADKAGSLEYRAGSSGDLHPAVEKKALKKADRRYAGINKAVDKLTGKAKVPATDK